MANRLDLSALDDLIPKGKDFELTAAQYMEKIGRPMPASVSGIKGKSAPLSRWAKENGYVIDSIEDKIMKTVKFKKISKETQK